MSKRFTLPQPLLLLLLAGYLAVSCWIFSGGFIKPLSLPFVLGCAALPFTWQRSETPVSARPLVLLSIAMLLLTLLVPVRTLLFFALGAAVCAALAGFGYRSRLSTLLCWVFLSPVFAYVANVFSFPIRMELASAAASILRLFSGSISAAGAMIDNGGSKYTVDPGCMGLNMFTASLLLSLVIAGYYEKREGRLLRARQWLVLLPLVVIVNVVSNLLRILVLVCCGWPPGSVLHELTGLLCLGLYVGVPLTFFIRWQVRRGYVAKPQAAAKPVPLGGQAVLLAGFIMLAIFVDRRDHLLHVPAGIARVDGYVVSEHGGGIVKLQRPGLLAYLKFTRGWYDAEHNPTICWEGSGYQIEDPALATIAGTRIYTAVLRRGGERFYTAWWYTDGRQQEFGQAAWRWAAFRSGRRWALVNITAPTAAGRDAEVARVLHAPLLPALFRIIEKQ